MRNKIKEVLERQILLIKPSEKESKEINKEAEKFIKELEKKIKKRGIKADVFIGGSLAKGTIIKKQKHDIDVFIRFDKKYPDEKISSMLGKIVAGKKIHGSRDYFQIKKGKMIFEVVPVGKITKPEEARNVTDLSYFHVNYIKKMMKKNKKLGGEIMLAKNFCYAQGFYGAESYIKGFSGYALELLTCYYGSFLKFIKAVRNKQKIILDPEKFYKNKQEILLELNEAKLQSPIVFVDPTFKERNALAALSQETFGKFKETCRSFLSNPDNKFFEKKDLGKELKKKYKNLIVIEVRTSKQKGDIAGSKLKKFSDFLTNGLKKYFEIKFKEFEYDDEKNIGKIYLSIIQKKDIIREGPPITSVEHLVRFKKKHKNCFIKKGQSYAREKPLTINKFLENLKKEKRTKEMKITKIELVNISSVLNSP